MKYLVVEAPGGEAAVLFPRSFMHAWMAGQMRPMRVVAAGFVRLADGRPECYGRSEGLGIAARPDRDSALVARALNGGAPAPEAPKPEAPAP